MTRRLIVSLVAAVLILACGTAAHAAFSDTKDSEYGAAVAAMARVGLVRGFPDGTFRPHLPITRVEFTTLVVRARGLESAARFVSGVTPYPDVPAAHWASGYVNIAADYGLVRGYPDGTFRPGTTITYGEALIMLVRLVGCEDQVGGTGISGYLALADQLGIASVRLDQHQLPATRGAVTQFTSRALMVPVGQPAAVPFPVGARTLLDGLEGVIGRTGVVADSWLRPDSVLQSSRITLQAGGTAQTLVLLNPAVGAGLLGMEVRVWTAGGDVVGLVHLTPANRVVTGELTNAVVRDGRLAEVILAGRQYPVVSDPILYRNYLRVDPTDRPIAWTGGSATAVLDDAGAVRYLDAVTFEGSWVVMGSDPAAGIMRVVDRDGRTLSISLRGYVEVTAVVGQATVSPYAIPRGTVLHYFSRPPARLYIEARTSARTLVIDGFNLVGDRVIIRAAGRDYPALGATVSVDGDVTFSRLGPSALVMLQGHSAVMHVDVAGQVRHVSARVMGPPPWTRLAMVVSPLRLGADGSPALSVIDSTGVHRDLWLRLSTVIRWGADATSVGLMSAEDVLRAAERMERGSLVWVSMAADGSVQMLSDAGYDARAAELTAGSPGTADKMVRASQRWTRVRPGAPLFVDDDRFVRVLSSWSLTDVVSAGATAWLSSPAVTEALTLTGLIQGGLAGAGEHGVVVGWEGATRTTILVETGAGLRAVNSGVVTIRAKTGQNAGQETSSRDSLRPGDYVMLVDGPGGLTLLEPSALELGTASGLTFVSMNGNTVTVRAGEEQRTWLIAAELPVLLAAGGVRRVGPDGLNAGMTVHLFDHDLDGVVDTIVIRSRP